MRGHLQEIQDPSHIGWEKTIRCKPSLKASYSMIQQVGPRLVKSPGLRLERTTEKPPVFFEVRIITVSPIEKILLRILPMVSLHFVVLLGGCPLWAPWETLSEVLILDDSGSMMLSSKPAGQRSFFEALKHAEATIDGAVI